MATKPGEATLGFVTNTEFSDTEMPAVPVAVFLQPDAEKLVVSSVYIDEGVLCIDVEQAE